MAQERFSEPQHHLLISACNIFIFFLLISVELEGFSRLMEMEENLLNGLPSDIKLSIFSRLPIECDTLHSL
ncbi:hypothetical protein MKW98_029024 [Papaver atlanticum]|uniref:F-box domain-containing protein n=1 Tax=Papaver atlanticum TaxID=357466 RepID=A0AAD4RZK5_9MAGN|nr:hypothetical protein MKW98_029024 [Papaver atlanticum]